MLKWDKDSSQLEFVDPCICNAWVAAAIVGSAAIGGAVSAYGASKASDAQQSAATAAANAQLQMYNTTASNLAPFRDLGSGAANYAANNFSSLLAPVNVDTSILNDPNSTIANAYKFINTQGQRGVTNSAAARGLATSGAALKGAATFATGSADTFYKDLFNMGVTNQTNAYNRLKGLIDTGENAAAMTGTAATATGQGVASADIAGGNAAAAGYNAFGTAAGNVANSVGTGLLVGGLYGKSGSSASGLPVASGPTYGNFGQFSPDSPLNAG